MKIKYILILLVLVSCGQKTKEKKETETVIKTQDAIEKSIDSSKTETKLSFDKVIGTIRTRSVPLIDATNFDSFIEEGDYDDVNVQTLKLEKVYPDFYKEGYNYRAISNYKLEISESFYSVVITVLKGDHEMETRLINYDLNGNLIASEIIAYDEIAEGWISHQSKIEANIITNTYYNWVNEDDGAVEETNTIRIEKNGKFQHVASDDVLMNQVIKQLNLDISKVKTDLFVAKIMPNNPQETIMVIPEIEDEDNEYYFELNSHIVIVNNDSGKITHKYFERSKTNGWTSDAIVLSAIAIDTTPYLVSDNTRAFGIRVQHTSMSKPNPYDNETISLFVKSRNSLKNILKNYDVMNHLGEWDTICFGKFTNVKNTLIISEENTNEHFNIIVKSKITEKYRYEDENGDCLSKDITTSESEVLKFNGEEYLKKDK